MKFVELVKHPTTQGLVDDQQWELLSDWMEDNSQPRDAVPLCEVEGCLLLATGWMRDTYEASQGERQPIVDGHRFCPFHMPGAIRHS